MADREAEVREALTEKYGAAWDTSELQEHFTVESFLAPFVVVVRKADGAKGSMQFTHNPRFYFDFNAV